MHLFQLVGIPVALINETPSLHHKLLGIVEGQGSRNWPWSWSTEQGAEDKSA
jgi:hypothetical protein